MRRLRVTRESQALALIQRQAGASALCRHLHRLHCVVVVARGNSCYRVAAWFGHAPRTVERWVRAFESRGDDALSDHSRPGRARKLSAEQERAIRALVAVPPCNTEAMEVRRWTGRLLVDHVARTMGVRISVRWAQQFLRDCGRGSGQALGPRGVASDGICDDRA